MLCVHSDLQQAAQMRAEGREGMLLALGVLVDRNLAQPFLDGGSAVGRHVLNIHIVYLWCHHAHYALQQQQGNVDSNDNAIANNYQ